MLHIKCRHKIVMGHPWVLNTGGVENL